MPNPIANKLKPLKNNGSGKKIRSIAIPTITIPEYTIFIGFKNFETKAETNNNNKHISKIKIKPSVKGFE